MAMYFIYFINIDWFRNKFDHEKSNQDNYLILISCCLSLDFNHHFACDFQVFKFEINFLKTKKSQPITFNWTGLYHHVEFVSFSLYSFSDFGCEIENIHLYSQFIIQLGTG